MRKITSLILSLCLLVLLCAVAVAEESHVHTFTEWETRKEATCTEPGTQIRLCTECGETETQSIAPTSHAFTEWVTDTQVSCAIDGKQVRLCTACGKTEIQTISAPGHDFTGWETIAQADCTTDGEKVRLCTVCGETEKQSIPAAGHTFTEWETRTEASCAKPGERIRLCTICGTTETEAIPTLEHTVETVPGQAATCTEDGLTEGSICSVCGEVLAAQEIIEAQGHTEETVPGQAATCTEDGLTEGVICSVCGEVLTAQKTIPATEHRFKAAVVAPTETTRGYTRHTCSVCGVFYKDCYTDLVKVEQVSESKLDSLVTNLDDTPKAYEEALLADGTTLAITAAAQAGSDAASGKLHIAKETLDAWKEKGIEQVSFVVGKVTVTVALSDLENENIAAITADIGEIWGYVITVDPAAAEKATVDLVGADQTKVDVTLFLEEMAVVEAE